MTRPEYAPIVRFSAPAGSAVRSTPARPPRSAPSGARYRGFAPAPSRRSSQAARGCSPA
ncbi:hypothetical protein LI90_742 [Carbonactinospora thermoautotrophica]|uniref:Uncharacterized protein n=1 Tax=Carbonactinospora thermoautotrophica TaxID=1469144 RepID=A0A132MN14_9ACTN|nr:hypothetical protein LI90_742 [Carbonactinospora thermoautotrophica]